MNNYHRYLKIPFTHLKPKVFDNLSKEPKVIFVKELDKNIIKWIESFGVIVSNVTEGIYTPPNKGKVSIHNDTNKLTNATKINFTWGPINSTTRWWKVKDETLLDVDVTDSKHITDEVDPDIVDSFDKNKIHRELICKEQDCKMIFEQTIDKPSLINVGQLHSTYNENISEGRWSLCYFLLNKDYTHLQFENALEIFKEAIYE